MQEGLLPRFVNTPGYLIDQLIEKLKVDLLQSAMNVNACARAGDIKRNRVTYGVAIKCASVLRDLGCEVEVPAWENGDFMQIDEVTVNERVTKLLSLRAGMER